MGAHESGTSDRTRTAAVRVAEATHRLRGAEYRALLDQLVALFEEARAEFEGERMDPGSFREALALLDGYPHGFALPEASLDPDGEVALDWFGPDRTLLSVSVSGDGSLAYAARLRDGVSHGVLRGGEPFPPAIVDLLRRLFHPI